MTKLRQLINLKIYPIKHIAKSCNKTVDAVLKYASGYNQPKAEAAILIAELFGVSPRWLWLDGRKDINDYEKEKAYVKKDEVQRMSDLQGL